MQTKLPRTLIESLCGIPGFDEKKFIHAHEVPETFTSVRLNPSKNQAATLQHFEQAAGTKLERVPWATSGYYLPKRPSFTKDPLFHAGSYYVQEASSMFLEEVLKQITISTELFSSRVLDLCASPGGKSTLIQTIIPPNATLIANEAIRSRTGALLENMIKWGGANGIVTSNDPRDFKQMENYFDIIVVDAPCSGSGLFRREPEAVNYWTIENVSLCARRQQRIIADIWPCLRKEGVLIYSTCSFSREENEDIANWVIHDLDAESFHIGHRPEWNVVETTLASGKGRGYRFYPYLTKGEGFFITAFRKNGGGGFQRSTKRTKREKIARPEDMLLREHLKAGNNLALFKMGEVFKCLPAELEADLDFIQSGLYIKRAGVALGKILDKQLAPDHELAMNILLERNCEYFNLSAQDAIKYLRKEALSLDSSVKGWGLVGYAQQPLGWIKILTGRVNNYYPMGWRIRN
ncbi:MAG TPA: hypothetical protein VKR32_14520 [Puia sp.]|nr:hypothetical protein [Puia sp.]